MNIFRRDRAGDEHLDEAIRAARSAAARRSDSLSQDARSRILDRSYREATANEPLPAVFVPTWKAAMATGFMIVLGTAGLVVPFVSPGNDLGATPRLIAYKDGPEVVFEIRNGDRPHEVRKSTDAERFRAGAVTVENGRFRDLAESGPVLVFYRVD